MTQNTKIDAADFLLQEAAEKVLEIVACTGTVDLGVVENRGQAEALADVILAKIRTKLAETILRDACLMAVEHDEMVASLATEQAVR